MTDQTTKNYHSADPLLTRAEVAIELGVSKPTVDRYRREGFLPAIRLAGRPRWRLSVVEALKDAPATDGDWQILGVAQ